MFAEICAVDLSYGTRHYVAKTRGSSRPSGNSPVKVQDLTE
jgi:hypothetical protein